MASVRGSPLGDLPHQLKCRGDRPALHQIVETVAAFWETWKPRVGSIVPAPPSNTSGKNQPVLELAKALSEQAGIESCTYRSGATASAIARLLIGQGGASAVYLLTLTRTRRTL